jgi:hypothetical protein
MARVNRADKRQCRRENAPPKSQPAGRSLLSSKRRTLPLDSLRRPWRRCKPVGRGPFPPAVFLGAAGTAAIGMLIVGENVTAVKLMSITFILVGVIGLNLSGVTPP